MAPANRQTIDPLIQRLAAEPYAFDFFAAVRALESAHADAPRVGCSVRPVEDWIRFEQHPHLWFAPSALHACDAPAAGPIHLAVQFFGLLGPNGPLPLAFTEHVLRRSMGHDLGQGAASTPSDIRTNQPRGQPARDTTTAGFLDIFHHRMLSLFYRAWAVHRQATDFDRPDESAFMRYVGALAGLGLPCFQGRDAVPDWAKLYFSGRLSSPTRTADGLAAMLQDFFGLPVSVEPFIGEWLPLPEANRCRLGESPVTGLLGQTTIVGSRVWACQLKFRIRMGPMSLVDYERMLPRGESFARLRDWVLNYVGQELHWDAQFVLLKDEVPPTHLGRTGRLGWTTWLKSRPFTRDADNLILDPETN